MPVSSGQSYKTSTIVIYDSRVVPDWKIPHITTLGRVVIYERKMFIRLATGVPPLKRFHLVLVFEPFDWTIF